MRLEGEREVVAIHAAAVIADSDELPAALFHVDPELRGARIQGVFDQLFYDRRRAFDDLARSDLVDDLGGEDANAGHRGYTIKSQRQESRGEIVVMDRRERSFDIREKLRTFTASGQVEEAMALLRERRSDDLPAWGVIEIARYIPMWPPPIVCWRLPDELGGYVLIELEKSLELIRPSDEFRIEFGGMSAAVGEVPLYVWRKTVEDGKERLFFGMNIDEYRYDLSSTQELKEVRAFLEMVSQASGCTVSTR